MSIKWFILALNIDVGIIILAFQFNNFLKSDYEFIKNLDSHNIVIDYIITNKQKPFKPSALTASILISKFTLKPLNKTYYPFAWIINKLALY